MQNIDNQQNSFVSGQALRGPNILTVQDVGSYNRGRCPTCGATGYVLDLTPAQEQKVRSFFDSMIAQSSPVSGLPGWRQLPENYSFIGNNCADLTAEGARAGFDWYDDIWISSFLTSPAQLELELRLSPFPEFFLASV